MGKSNLSGPKESTGDPWIEDALELARKAAEKDEVPVGAVVVHEGKIIGRGHNLRESEQNPTAHAEILALVEAAKNLKSWRLNGCTLFVTLEPCPMCLAAAQLSRIQKIVYGTVDPKGGALSLGYRLHEDARTNHRFAVELTPHPECARVLSAFFEAKRKNQG